MITQYKAVIFDWDGTLVDSTDWVLGAHNHVRAIMNLEPWTKEEIFGCSSRSARETYPEVYQDKAPEALKLLQDYVDKNNLDSSTPFPAAIDLLNALKKADSTMGVVSNKRHEPLLQAIEHLGWQKYFKTAIGAGKAKQDKPSAEPLLMAINNLNDGMSPEDVLYIGDTETDLLCAKNAGCQAVFIQSDKPRPDLVAKYQPKYVFFDLLEFIDMIQDHKQVQNKAC